MKVENSFYEIPFLSDPFDGIFSHLRHIYGSGLAGRGLISVKINKSTYTDTERDKLLENDHSTFWYLLGVTGNYILFSFTNHSVFLSSMTIKTCSSKSWYYNPSIAVESSSDGYNWNTVYSEFKSNKLTTDGSTYTWNFNSPNRGNFIRFISLDNIKNETSHGIYISTFEFFGKIYLSPEWFYCNVQSKSVILGLYYVYVFLYLSALKA